MEREAARILGGRRIPAPGRHGPGADPGDIELPGWFVEVRRRARVDLWAWWNLTMAEAAGAGRRPLMVVKQAVRGGQLVAVLRLADLAEVLHAEVPSRTARPAGPDPGPAPAAGAGGRGDSPDRELSTTYAAWCWFCRGTSTITVTSRSYSATRDERPMIVVSHRCERGHELHHLYVPVEV